MDDAVLESLGFAAILVGVGMVVVFVRQLYVTGRFAQEYRPALWEMPPGGRRELERRVRETVRAGARDPAADHPAEHDPAAQDLPALRAIASEMVAGRVNLWSLGSLVVMQLGGLVFHPTTLWFLFVAVLGLFLAVGMTLIERGARAGAAFLSRYPPARAEPEVER